MARLISAFLAFVMVMIVLKMIVIAIVVAGLIFRTKETIGLLFIGGVMTFIAAFPVIGLSLLAIIALVAIFKKSKSDEPVDEEKFAAATRLIDPAE